MKHSLRGRRIPRPSAELKTLDSRGSVWSAVASAPLSCARRLAFRRSRLARPKAAVNAPHSTRFARTATIPVRASVWKCVSPGTLGRGARPQNSARHGGAQKDCRSAAFDNSPQFSTAGPRRTNVIRPNGTVEFPFGPGRGWFQFGRFRSSRWGWESSLVTHPQLKLRAIFGCTSGAGKSHVIGNGSSAGTKKTPRDRFAGRLMFQRFGYFTRRRWRVPRRFRR